MPESPPSSDVRQRLVEMIAEVVGEEADAVAAAGTLAEIGVDSLAMVEVVIGVEQGFGVAIADEDVAGITTLDLLTSYVASRPA